MTMAQYAPLSFGLVLEYECHGTSIGCKSRVWLGHSTPFFFCLFVLLHFELLLCFRSLSCFVTQVSDGQTFYPKTFSWGEELVYPLFFLVLQQHICQRASLYHHLFGFLQILCFHLSDVTGRMLLRRFWFYFIGPPRINMFLPIVKLSFRLFVAKTLTLKAKPLSQCWIMDTDLRVKRAWNALDVVRGFSVSSWMTYWFLLGVIFVSWEGLSLWSQFADDGSSHRGSLESSLSTIDVSDFVSVLVLWISLNVVQTFFLFGILQPSSCCQKRYF